MNKIILGSHVCYKSKDYLIGSVNETISYNGNCFMIFTGPPQNFNRKEIDYLNVKTAIEILKRNNLDVDNIIVHAPYLINLCSPNINTRKLAVEKLKIEVIRTQQLCSNKIVLHPGCSLTLDRNNAIEFIANGINEVIQEAQNNVIICIETMSGKGSEVGKTFEELKAIIDLIEDKSKIGVCLDTCHIHEAGYDVRDVNKILDEFDNVIGMQYLKVIHLNDSKNPVGAHKDRHENIGMGKIGFAVLCDWVHNKRLVDIPKVLETPYWNNKPIYKQEINNLLTKKWSDYE